MSSEAQRQQRLLQQLWQPAPDAALTVWLRDAPAAQARGLRAYRANAQATAARALAAAYPTVAALVGADTFGQISHRHWLQQPPQRGDLAEWGADKKLPRGRPGLVSFNSPRFTTAMMRGRTWDWPRISRGSSASSALSRVSFIS